jgi:hypothetical protein
MSKGKLPHRNVKNYVEGVLKSYRDYKSDIRDARDDGTGPDSVKKIMGKYSLGESAYSDLSYR